MRRCLRICPVLLLLVVFGAPPPAAAQDTDAKDLHPGMGNKDGPSQQGPQLGAPGTPESTEKPAPTFSYILAIGATIIVLCVLCVPSRKSESATTRRR